MKETVSFKIMFSAILKDTSHSKETNTENYRCLAFDSGKRQAKEGREEHNTEIQLSRVLFQQYYSNPPCLRY